MDRTTIIGFLLIGVVLMVWMYLNAPPPQPPSAPRDSTSTFQKNPSGDSSRTSPPPGYHVSASADTLGKLFSHLKAGERKTIVIETDNYRAEISTVGGAVQSWILKNYKTWDQQPVNLINAGVPADFHLLFYSSEGKLINTK